MDSGKWIMESARRAERCLTPNPRLTVNLTPTLNLLRPFGLRLRLRVRLRSSAPSAFSALSAVKSTAFGDEPRMPSTLLWPMDATGERSPRRCDPTSFTPRLTHNLTLNLTPTLNLLRLLRVRSSAPSAFSALSAVKSTAFGDEPRMPSTLLWPTDATGERSPRRCDPTSFTPHPTHNLTLNPTLNPLRLLRVRPCAPSAFSALSAVKSTAFGDEPRMPSTLLWPTDATGERSPRRCDPTSFTPRLTPRLTLNLNPTLNPLRLLRVRPSAPSAFSALSAVKSTAFGDEPRMPSTLLWPMDATGERSPRRCDPTSFTPRLTPRLTLNLLRLLRLRPCASSAFSALSAVKSTAFGDEPRMPSTLLWPTDATGERSPRRCDPTSFTPHLTNSLTLNLTPTLNLLRLLRLKPCASSAFSALSAVKSTAFGDEPRMPSTLLWPTDATGERSPRRCDPTSFTPHLTNSLTVNLLREVRLRLRLRVRLRPCASSAFSALSAVKSTAFGDEPRMPSTLLWPMDATGERSPRRCDPTSFTPRPTNSLTLNLLRPFRLRLRLRVRLRPSAPLRALRALCGEFKVIPAMTL